MRTIFQYENGIIKLKRFTYYDYKYQIGRLINIEFDKILDIKYVKCNELPEKYIHNLYNFIVKDIEK